MSCFGGKGGAGIYQRLINQIPPHEAYIEIFLGGGSIMKNKKPAFDNIGCDVDYRVRDEWDDWVNEITDTEEQGRTVYTLDAMTFIKDYNLMLNDRRAFLYCDPPYIMETRKSGPQYRFEFSNDQHTELLKLLLSLKCMVMISGYRHEIYDDALSSWRRIDYKANTRHGLVDESVWMNYPEPTELHDYRYLGRDFREREKIQRQQKRWLKRLRGMPVLQRKAISAAILNIDGGVS